MVPGVAKPALQPEDYTIACICPLPLEAAPLEAMLDKYHECTFWSQHNSYTLGEIGGHNVVIATMPEMGNNKAATVAVNLMNDFKSIKLGLLIGVGGGLPSEQDDIRLGDVVIGISQGINGGVVQFDRGKSHPGGHFERTGSLNKPPDVLLSTVQRLRSHYLRERRSIPQILANMTKKFPHMTRSGYTHPGQHKDILFQSDYVHRPGPTCAKCDAKRVVRRSFRPCSDPSIHYGLIGSSNMVIKDGMVRDVLKQELQLLCVDMEAAGVADLPFLTIRGISDYADSHKNKEWQPYAAATAAAYAKDLISMFPPVLRYSGIQSPISGASLPRTEETRNPRIDMRANKIFYESTFNSSGPMYF